MRFASLGSGSKGNSTIIQSTTTCIMIDCGFSIKECIRRLQRLDKTPDDIDAILVTHEHSDHWKGVLPLATRYSIDVFITAGCLRATGFDSKAYSGVNVIDSHKTFKLGDIKVKPIPVPHDANEPVQFILEDNENRFGILTDVGSITPYIIEQYSGCNGLLIEANHDQALLESGSYPRFLKDRVSGQWGHLNNQQTAALINEIDQSCIQQLVIGHISLNNNNKQLAKSSIENVFKGSANIIYADQEEGFDWLQLSAL